MHLWEQEHEYYCQGEYPEGAPFDSWDSFLEEWGDAENTYNLVVRFDWYEADEDDERPTDQVHIHVVLQRKGILYTIPVCVTKEDEPRVLRYLNEKKEYLQRLWLPLT